MICKNPTFLKISIFQLAACALVAGCFALTAYGETCSKPQSTRDVLLCVLKNSPSGQRAELVVDISKAKEEAAGKLSNPTVSLQSGFLSPGNSGGSDHQISLTQPIDLGGKRGSRVREAESMTGQRVADQVGLRVDLTIETLTKLNRLRQLTVEMKVLEETHRTVSKLIKLFKNRPSLTPEQETSLVLFTTAENDLELKTISLEEETKAILKFFSLATGFSSEDLLPILPKNPPSWEVIKSAENFQSPAKQRAEADLSLALAELDSQKAASWPELAVGPYAQFQSDDTNKTSLFGVALSLEIPVLSLNAAGRGAAQKALLSAEKNLELLKKEEFFEQDMLLESYLKSVNALTQLPQLVEQESQHNRLEKLFVRGVVPSSLVIESHRQILEFTRSRHEREEKALEALLRLKALQGKITEASL